MPFRVFAAGEVLTAANVNDYLAEQAISTFAGTAARASAITAPTEGQFAYLSDSDSLTFYNGSAWVNAGSAIAGTALSSGTATSGQVLTANGSGGVSFGNGGLTLLNTTSFSAQSSISVNDVFSANYDNYRILINAESAGGPELGIRMRVSGSDNSSAIYYSQRLRAQDSTASAARQVTQTYFPIGPVQTSQRNVAIIELNNPFAAIKTTMTATMGLDWYELYLRTSLHDTATSYTGFTIVLSSSNITGKVSTYGYNQ